MIKKSEYYGNFFLFVTALIWGSAFVAQKGSMDYIGPFTFNASRSTLSAIFLLTFIVIKDKLINKNEDIKLNYNHSFKNKNLIVGGILCGICLFIASALQQYGLIFVTAGKAAFITTLYILMIPLISIFFKKRVSNLTWFAVVLGTFGLYFLAIPSSGFQNINIGDFIEFVGAFFWGAHILVIDKYSKDVDVVKLSFLQFFVSTLLSWVVAFTFEDVSLVGLSKTFLMIAYAGVMSGGVGYTLQMVGQKYSNNPTLASLILSFESVFGVLTGYLLLGENLTKRELLGCVAMFIAVIIAQLPDDFFKKKYMLKE